MSRIIRTPAVTGNAVTVGSDAGDLFEGPEAGEPAVDLGALIDQHVDVMRKSLNADWEARLRQEHDTLMAAAERRLSEAEQEHQEEVVQVHQQRYEEGHAAGVAEKEIEATEAVNRMAVLHESLKADRRQVLLESEELVVDLAVDIAHKVAGIRSEIDPEVLARIMRRALGHLSDRSNLVVKVHPDDLRVANRFAQHWVERVDKDAVLKVRTSDHVARGGCMIEGTEEFVDARLREQFGTLHDELINVVNKGAVTDDVDAYREIDDPQEVDEGSPSDDTGEEEDVASEDQEQQ